MKAKEFFEKRAKQAKFNENEAFVKFLATLTDAQEVPDDIDKLIDDHFLTRERAIADKDVIKPIWAESLNAVDLHIKNLLKPLEAYDKFAVNEIDAQEKDTFKKLKAVTELLPKVIEKAKAGNPDQSEEVKQLKKINDEWVQKIKDINTERETEKTELVKKHETEKSNILLDFSLKDRINKIEFAKEHADLKPAISEVIMTALKKDNVLSVDQSGNILVQVMDNGVPKQRFNGNDAVTIDKLLEEKVKPYVKRNDADGKDKQPPKHRQQQAQPEGKMTLKEMQRAANPAPARV